MARNRMTKEDVTILEDQIYEALENDHPQSIRHVFYLMTNPTLAIPVQKTDAGYIQVQRRIKYMRQSARIPNVGSRMPQEEGGIRQPFLMREK